MIRFFVILSFLPPKSRFKACHCERPKGARQSLCSSPPGDSFGRFPPRNDIMERSYRPLVFLVTFRRFLPPPFASVSPFVRSALIRSNKTEAGSSFGSCGANSPRKAFAEDEIGLAGPRGPLPSQNAPQSGQPVQKTPPPGGRFRFVHQEEEEEIDMWQAPCRVRCLIVVPVKYVFEVG